MQVQHETQLLEADDFEPAVNIRSTLDAYTLSQPFPRPIEHLACSPVESQIAVHLSNSNQVTLIDTKTFHKRDRFPLKPCDKKYSRSSFTVKGLNFSPDGTRIAVGQTDCIIYIYKLSNQQPNFVSSGNQTSGKTIITGKFSCSSPVTCLLWMEWGIVFGTQDGKVKLVLISKSSSYPDNQSLSSTSTRVIGLYNSPKGCMPVSLSYRSPYLVVGFADGNILLSIISLEYNNNNLIELNWNPESSTSSATQRQSSQPPFQYTFIEHSCPPVCLTIIQNNTLCCAGADGRLSIHSIRSERSSPSSSNKFDSSLAPKAQLSLIAVWRQNIELNESVESMDYSLINEILVVATSKRILFIKYDRESTNWLQQTSFIELKNSHLIITSLVWSKDSAQLIVGTSGGSLELFKCSWNKQSINDELDICHIAKNRVRITDRARNLLATYRTQHDIKQVNLLHNGMGVIIWTSNSLLLALLGQPGAQSEIQWITNREKGSTKFSFKHQDFVLIYNNFKRELKIVRLGDDKLAYTIQVETVLRPNTICVRRYPARFPQIVESIINKQSTQTNRHINPANVNQNSSIYEAQLSSKIGFKLSLNPQPVIENESNENHDSTLVERLAYVSDGSVIMVVDLKSNLSELNYRHQEAINWVKFSYTGYYLLFEDSLSRLYLIDLTSIDDDNNNNNNNHNPDKTGYKMSITLLVDRCEFASWFERTDILVAQSKHRIFIWYNIREMNDRVCYDSRKFNYSYTLPIIDLSLTNEQSHKMPYPVINGLSEFGSHINLSNGNIIQLDEIKVKFYTELSTALCNRLDSAFKVLKSYEMEKKNAQSLRNLWSKLGWIAVEQYDCRIAMYAFDRLQYKSMIKFLEECLAKPSEEQQWRLAMLCGDWTKFEQIREPEQIIITYKRLNRWSQLIDYLTRTQQFRQKDLAEQEHLKWLIANRRHLEAARIQFKMGDMFEALEMLMQNRMDEEGANILIENYQGVPLRLESKIKFVEQKPNLQLEQATKNLIDRLIRNKQFEKAAILSEKVLANDKEALDLYLRGHNFKSALEITKRIELDRVAEIEDLFGQYLVKEYSAGRLSRRKALEAIDHFVTANEPEKALEAAINLKDFHQALRQLQQISSKTNLPELVPLKIRDCSLIVAEYFANIGETSSALEAFLLGQHYKKAVELHLKVANFEEAFKLSSEFVYKNDRTKLETEFNQLAEKLASLGKWDEAEKLYLIIEKPDLIMDMYKKAKNYTRMLNIVERFFPDLLESTLLLLARESESEGRFDEAERYLLQASPTEWTNVVRMYRIANKWSDAYRVALEHCYSKRDPLLVQLAYWWCKSLINGGNLVRACQLIDELEVADEVLDFACENRNFQLAIDLCSITEHTNEERKIKRRALTKRYAAYLEREQKFDKAEEVLMAEQQVKEVVRMYLDNGMYKDALRVIEEKLDKINVDGTTLMNQTDVAGLDKSSLVELLNETLIESANRLSADEMSQSKTRRIFQLNGDAKSTGADDKLARAQQLYLRAGRPDLVVEMYKERELWQEAVQVAQRFAPQLVESVELALDARTSEDLAPIVETMRNNNLRTLSNQPASKANEIEPLDLRPAGKPTSANNRLLNKAKVSMRSGDMRETKVALGNFLESLVDGELDGVDTSFGKNSTKGAATQIDRQLEQLEISVDALLSSMLSGGQFERCSVAAQQVVARSDKLAQCFKWGRWPIKLANGDIESANDHQEDLEADLIKRNGLLIWCKARNLLGNCVKQLDGSFAPISDNGSNGSISIQMNQLLEQLWKRLLAFHYIVLHGYLANKLQITNATARGLNPRAMSQHLPVGEPTPSKMDRLAAISLSRAETEGKGSFNETILNQLGRLSVSLLRYTDFMNLSNAFYVAGLWLVAARQHETARFVWSRLVEFVESGSLASNETDRDQLNRADVPLARPKTHLRHPSDLDPEGMVSALELNEVRRWLLESLIGGGGGGDRDRHLNQSGSSRLNLDERGLWASSLRVGGGLNGGRQLDACLVCGYPVFANDPDQLTLNESSRSASRLTLSVHLSEWRKLALMSNARDDKQLPAERPAKITGQRSPPESSNLANSSRRAQADGINRLDQIGDFISWLGSASSEAL